MLRQLFPTSRRLLCFRQTTAAWTRPSIMAALEQQQHLCRSFSAPAQKIPSNLTIDPRSSFAPTSKKPAFAQPSVMDDKDDDDKKNVEREEDEDEVFSVNANTNDDDESEEDLFVPEPQVLHAIPLPDRLHVDIQTLFAPAYDSTVGTIWLDPNVFGRNPIRVDLLKRAVLYYRNKKRGRRKAHSKTISEVSGSGKKMRPQKGQGMARVGHKRAAHFRGGAKAHGPKNLTDYGNTKLNKKVRRQALCHALSQRLLEGNLILLDQLHGLQSYKTRELVRILDEWGVGGKGAGASALILDSYYPQEGDEDKASVASHYGVPVPFHLAAANIPRITLGNEHSASVYEILRHDKLIMTLATMEKLESRLKNV